MVTKILKNVLVGNRLSDTDAVELLRSNDLEEIADAANTITNRLHPENYRTYNIDRNINYTNACVSGCKFCAFCRDENHSEAYIIDRELLFQKIAETIALGGEQILLQGGLHPSLPFEWYEEMIRSIKAKFPSINVHGFSPTEIVFFSEKFSMTPQTVLERLRDAGLGSLPGGGAEILADRVRNELSPKKATVDRWLEVCKIWHEMGGRGSATMMFGHIETLEERIEHLRRLRDLQDETSGFTAFICWTFQPGQTKLQEIRKAGAWDYLKTVAVSRLYLDNFPNIQASWVTQGMQISPLSLFYGANDLGSVMIEENVVAAAGTAYKTNEHELRNAIKKAGFEPRRRDVFYTRVG